MESPCLVFDLDAVDRTLGLFGRYVPGLRLYYSLKANNDPTILTHLQSKGLGFDVASVNEIGTAIAAGIAPEDMILSNTVKTTNCIREIFRRRVFATTIDNELDLKALALESTFHSFRPQVFVRIKLQPLGVEINLNEKFGCTLERAAALLAKSHELGLPPAGVHFHVGTQCRNVQSYRVGIESAIEVLRDVRTRHGLNLTSINIGGGFPDELAAAEYGGLESFITELGEIVKAAQDHGFNLIAEPGRVIAAGACTAVARVIGRNVHDGKDWLYLDDGIYGLFSTAHYEKRHFDLIPVEKKKGKAISYVVAGPTCDSLDVISLNTMLPADMQPGDYVLANHAGAYSISVKSQFNGMGQISTAVSQQAVVSLEVPEDIKTIVGGL